MEFPPRGITSFAPPRLATPSRLQRHRERGFQHEGNQNPARTLGPERWLSNHSNVSKAAKMSKRQLISTIKAAASLNVSPNTIRTFIADGSRSFRTTPRGGSEAALVTTPCCHAKCFPHVSPGLPRGLKVYELCR